MQKEFSTFFRSLSIIVVSLFLVFSAIAPQAAYASDADSPVQVANDIVTSGSTAAEKVVQYTLNPLAWAVAKALLQSVVNSTVRWINSGFKGSPAFATNLSATLQNVADAQANSFIQQLLTNGAIKSPFQNLVANTVSTNYFRSTGSNGFFAQNPFTLNQVSSNPQAFLAGNFSAGGWDAWLSAAMNSSNNPYGATMLAENALSSQVANAQKNQTTELNWGSGFLSQKNCPGTGDSGGGTTAPDNSPIVAATGANAGSEQGLGGSATSLASGNSSVVCALGSIINPGSTIKAALDKTLGSSIDTLVQASTFNEIVNALLGQLMNHLLGPGGLLGLSQPSAATGGVSYFNQPTTATGQLATSTSGGGTVSQNLSTQFSQTVQGQITQLQSFQAEWQIINAAAQAAAAALQSNSCPANQSALTGKVQPIINQATTELAQASAAINSLNGIINELPAQSSTADNSSQISQASSDYSALLASNVLPSATDLQTAQQESVAGTDSSGNPTYLSQMNTIAQQAPSCGVTP